ncbi:hypothetical protein PCH_Pc22g19980 [Penicillium rubens Wisconsin 54-1255]|uniref:Uncharacterized protein n=1 Tax=Penicillium rubens (strain ATCC 28089 / DSM 1075 / NRRL 1951 / Wisconsin 54-1255) TaxID=500485 RepID=B6HQE0_PENRW|nr:hypothetical protein PCH_Pc22g19980 [Penicillium rubens Wisconsin 54-1255]
MTRLYSVETIGLTKRAAVQTLYDVSGDWLNVCSDGTKGQNPCAIGASSLSSLSSVLIFDFVVVDMMLRVHLAAIALIVFDVAGDISLTGNNYVCNREAATVPSACHWQIGESYIRTHAR